MNDDTPPPTGRWAALAQGLIFLLPSLALLLAPLLWLDENQRNAYTWLPLFGVPVLLVNWLSYPRLLHYYERLRPVAFGQALAAQRSGARWLDWLLRPLLFLLAIWLWPVLFLLVRLCRREL